MRRQSILVLLAATGSVFCWLPSTMEPSLDLAGWIPLSAAALISGLSTCLSGGRWLRFLFLSGGGAFIGVGGGLSIWPPSDPIARSYGIFAIAAAVLAATLVSLVSVLIGRKITASNQVLRRVIWLVLACCVAFGPVILAITPSLVARRVTRNDLLATERFSSLKNDIERIRAESGDLRRICDGQTLRRNYSGPPFRDQNWRYIAGNYVKEDGYIYGIWINCPAPNGYMIDAHPDRQEGDGTRQFCTDGAGQVGCGMQSTSPQFACAPCTK